MGFPGRTFGHRVETMVEPDAPESFETLVGAFQQDYAAMVHEVGRVIVGMEGVIEQVMICLLAGGHSLLEGVPGLGKTLLVRTLAEALDLQFSRIPFPPDLMPADIIGTNIVVADEGGAKAFQFQRGPIFGNLILADEINRATPKTQSAVLEAMQEGTVSVARVRHRLPAPFFVLATQNPLEMEGTYPLPEAQLDRFFFKLDVAYPSVDELVEIADRTTGARVPQPQPVADGATIRAMQHLARGVPIAQHVTEAAARLVRATLPHDEHAPEIVRRYVNYGSSPRGMQALILAGKIIALLDGRYNVAVDDLQAAALPALRHHLILNFEAQAEGVTADAIIQEVVSLVDNR